MQWTLPGAHSPATPRQDDLLLRARQRDSSAWSEIYAQNYLTVYKYIYGRLGRKEEAEDLAAQVFLEAMQSIDAYRDMGRPLIAWLFGIARNLVNGGVRKARRVESVDATGEDQLVDAGFSFLFSSLTAESLDLTRALDQLTKEQRETLILRFFVGLTAKETARVVGKSEQAVYALQVRAIATLRRFLAEEPQGPRERLAA
jgi:RNA polymerase sigma-70 factor (ECF subfamily)